MKTLTISFLALLLNIIYSHSQSPDILIADFEGTNYNAWIVTGTAFGSGPAHGKIGKQQEVTGYLGNGLVNTFNGGDGPIGTLTSPEFKIERSFISFYIGGGTHEGQTCINLLVNGKVERTATGSNNERLELSEWDVSSLKGQSAKIQIVDNATGGWGHLNIDQIFLSDVSATAFFKKMDKTRIWTRLWENQDLLVEKPFALPLHFRFIPSMQSNANGGFELVNGTEKDILAAGYDVSIDVTVGLAKQLKFNLCGTEWTWDSETRLLNNQTNLPLQNGRIGLRFMTENLSVKCFTSNGDCIISTFESANVQNPALTISTVGGTSKLNRMEVFGLRSSEPTLEESQLATLAEKDKRLFYQSKSYTIYGGSVVDSVYGAPAAYVPDSNTIVSPTRVTESFRDDLDVWRPRPLGRVIDHQTIWHPTKDISRFPGIRTGWPTVDMACNVALDVLQRCGSGEFARNEAEKGLWEAGFFWGEFSGFGIWLRDATHVALRSGNLIDSEVAAKTLCFTAQGGIDNGVDGVAMPMIGLWDLYLVTGNKIPITESWDKLKVQIAKLDAQFVTSKGLIKAAHSTSNDNFAEPEAGGYALGTETYFMQAYRAMSEMGQLMNEDVALINAWTARAQLLTDNIRKLYWKSTPGIFTTGPQGSTGYANNYWESSGQEMAIWPRFNIASSAQRRSVLDNLPKMAMNEFGVNVFPYRAETNHFCQAAWVAWSAGIAAAAGREGRLDILQQLIGQQVRNAVMNKTFFEVIDYKSGQAWRWPGQLWQATGFLSYFYLGVLGMEYNKDGLTFFPAVPETLANMEVRNFQYRNANFQIKVKGWGTSGYVMLDGARVETIPTYLEGEHTIELIMNGLNNQVVSPTANQDIDMYPIPAKEVLHLSNLNGCKNISIYDIQGRFIKDIAYSNPDINISDLSTGMYLIKIHNLEGDTLVKQFMKN